MCVCVGLGARSLPLRDGGTTGGLCVIGIDDHYGLCVGTNGGHSTLLHPTSQRVWHYIPTLFSGNAFICLASFYSLIHTMIQNLLLPSPPSPSLPSLLLCNLLSHSGTPMYCNQRSSPLSPLLSPPLSSPLLSSEIPHEVSNTVSARHSTTADTLSQSVRLASLYTLWVLPHIFLLIFGSDRSLHFFPRDHASCTISPSP